MKFVVTIELGNDAMQTGDDVAYALERIEKRLREYPDPLTWQVAGHVRDENGNTVGHYGVKDE